MSKKMKRIFIPITAIILLFLAASPGFAQNPITATVDRTALSTDEIVTLAVVVSVDGQPVMPSLAGFNVLGTGTSSQISIVNGSMNSTIVYNYHLQPTQTGPLTIDPISLTVNGQTYTTQPITVQVTQGTGQPQRTPASGRAAMPNIQSLFGSQTGRGGFGSSLLDEVFGNRGGGGSGFVEAGVSNPAPYLGEPIVYTFRFYQDSGNVFGMMDQPQYTPPSFTGFWAEGQDGQNRYRAQGNDGKIYDVTELTSVLVPSKMGEITIAPARLTTSGFFDAGGQMASEPIVVNVQPLPAGAPANFSGGVGQFAIEAGVDTTRSKVNEPITWKVTLSGRGNINTVSDPIWPDMQNWRSFESEATVNTQVQEGQIVGNRVYERLLVPQAEGEFVIPALKFSTFDPVAGQYQTISTQPIPVSVAPGAPGTPTSTTPTPAPIPEADGKEIVEQMATDIRYLKPVPSKLSQVDGPITASPLYWLAWGIPLVGLMGNFGWQRRRNFWQNNAGLARSSQARKKARRALAQAQKQNGDIFKNAGQILTTYLADKLDQPVLGLTHPALIELLTERSLKPELIERVHICLSDAELGRFSPDAGTPDHARNLLKEIDILIGDLETQLS